MTSALFLAPTTLYVATMNVRQMIPQFRFVACNDLASALCEGPLEAGESGVYPCPIIRALTPIELILFSIH